MFRVKPEFSLDMRLTLGVQKFDFDYKYLDFGNDRLR